MQGHIAACILCSLVILCLPPRFLDDVSVLVLRDTLFMPFNTGVVTRIQLPATQVTTLFLLPFLDFTAVFTAVTPDLHTRGEPIHLRLRQPRQVKEIIPRLLVKYPLRLRP